MPTRVPSPSFANNIPLSEDLLQRQLQVHPQLQSRHVDSRVRANLLNNTSSTVATGTVISTSREWDGPQTPNEWRQKILGLAPSPDTRPSALHISVYRSPNVSDVERVAAESLINALVTYHQGTQPPLTDTLYKFSYADLATGKISIFLYAIYIYILFWLLTADFSDQSVGPGPVHAVYERALKILTEEPSMWKPHYNGTFTWNVRPIPTTPLRLAKACTAGTLIALGLLWYGMSFHPISFWLVGLCASTFDDLKDLSFIKSIDEELATTLSAWPLDPSTPFPSLGSIDLSNLIINHLGVTVSGTMQFYCSGH